MSDCLFCGIAAGDIPADVIYRDEDFVVFRDISPTAPTHILVIPVQHHENIAELANADVELAGRFVRTAEQSLSRRESMRDSGLLPIPATKVVRVFATYICTYSVVGSSVGQPDRCACATLAGSPLPLGNSH